MGEMACRVEPELHPGFYSAPTYTGQRPEVGCVCFAEEDIKLNSTLLLWPDQIEDVFENSRNLLLSKRDQAEMDLAKRYRSV